MSEQLQTDAVVVGAGIAGLWSAKELVDRGMRVVVVEKDSALACGQTTRNEGWLHAGTYHSVAIANEEDALRVTERTMYGHDAIVAFAPESIDHRVSYALTASSEFTEKALERWGFANIPHRRLAPHRLPDADRIDTSRVDAAFRVKDKSVNSVTLCRRLAAHIIANGGSIITNAEFTPVDATQAQVRVDGYNDYTIHSERFLLAAGAGLNKLVDLITGRELPMRYFQAHLLVTPRLTQDNYFYLDTGEAGIMSHGMASIVGINRDGKELNQPSYTVDQSKEQLVHDAVERMLPGAQEHRSDSSRVVTIACCKPDIYQSTTDTQSLNVQLFDIAPNYTCALPGKMTESPYLGRAAAFHLLGENSDTIIDSSISYHTDLQGLPPITPRPADRWMQSAA